MGPNIMNSEIMYDWGKFCVEGDFADFQIFQNGKNAVEQEETKNLKKTTFHFLCQYEFCL